MTLCCSYRLSFTIADHHRYYPVLIYHLYIDPQRHSDDSRLYVSYVGRVKLQPWRNESHTVFGLSPNGCGRPTVCSSTHADNTEVLWTHGYVTWCRSGVKISFLQNSSLLGLIHQASQLRSKPRSFNRLRFHYANSRRPSSFAVFLRTCFVS